MCETIQPGGEVGQLNAQIVGNQFWKLMVGDRFFYSHRPDQAQNVPGLPSKIKQNVLRYINSKNSFFTRYRVSHKSVYTCTFFWVLVVHFSRTTLILNIKVCGVLKIQETCYMMDELG